LRQFNIIQTLLKSAPNQNSSLTAILKKFFPSQARKIKAFILSRVKRQSKVIFGKIWQNYL